MLAFLNHYNGGAASMIALAVWHLIFRARGGRLQGSGWRSAFVAWQWWPSVWRT